MIIIPKICGTCNGANMAINKVYDAYEKEQQKINPKKVVVYKEILHNKRVINDLLEKDIECVDSLENINDQNIVIIRAHGEGKNTYDILKEKNIEYIDATCPNVIRIHDIINDRYKKNYTIIIIGKRTGENSYHPEVEGSNGWCDNQAYIISEESDIDKITTANENILVICQTTANEDTVKKYAEIIRNKFNDKNVEFVNSICNAQKLIQTYSIKTAQEVDIMLVIGGKNSSNTNELYKKCAEYCETVKISSLDDVKEWLTSNPSINKNIKIGLTGGASTPQHEILEYKQYIENYLNNI